MFPTHHNELAAPEAPRRRFRKLRIAFSVVCLLACVLLIALWVDSYWFVRCVNTRDHRLMVTAATLRGVLGIDLDINQTSDGPGTTPKVYWSFGTTTAKTRDYGLLSDGLRVISFAGFRWTSEGSMYEADVPFWCLALLTVALAILPWFRWRFSLRTLLIATTLVAVVLGLVVYAVK